MLAELIASTQRAADENGNGGNGSGNGAVAAAELDEEATTTSTPASSTRRSSSRASTAPTRGPCAAIAFAIRPLREDDRRGRFRRGGTRGLGVLILTHRRLLVSQFKRDLTTEGYATASPTRSSRAHASRARARSRSRPTPGSRGTEASSPRTYHLVLCDEAHTALGEKTSAAIRAFHEPLYIGMTATEQLIAKQVSDVFPASVDDLPLGDAARRGLIAPLRSLRAARRSDQLGPDRRRGLRGTRFAAALDHEARTRPLGRQPLRASASEVPRHRLRGRRRPRLQPRAGVPRRRAQDGSRLRDERRRPGSPRPWPPTSARSTS